jgi:hypothetical protein
MAGEASIGVPSGNGKKYTLRIGFGRQLDRKLA